MDVSRHVGAVELTENPMPSAKPSSTNASAAAATAPAMTAPHRMSEYCSARGLAGVSTTRGLAGVSMLIATDPFVGASAQSQQRQDGHDHDDQADEVDEAAHGFLPM